MGVLNRAVLGAVSLLAISLVAAAPSHADEKCTNQIDYAGDPRSNAEINGIGFTTGQCPAPMTGGVASNGTPAGDKLPPGCNWNTDTGTQACLGGGPFDAGKNGNGDTYGPSGEAGFLYDTRLILPSARRLNDAQLLAFGRAVCTDRRAGRSEEAVKSSLAAAFTKVGLDPYDAGYFVIDAEMYLCPGLR